MKNRKLFLPLAVVVLATPLYFAAPVIGAEPSPGAKQPSHGGQPTSGWREDFNGPRLDKKLWLVSNGQAPGYVAGYHIGYYDSSHVSFVSQNGSSYLRLLLTQETGTVDSNSSGVISRGALVYTKGKYGYGTYQWRMRMSSTATTPNGIGNDTSGSVSAGFVYVNNSQTEIDFEFSGLHPDTLYMVNWLNPDPQRDPTGANETFDILYPFTVSTAFHDYKFVWQPGQIEFFVDGVLKATHTENVPSAPAYFMINHWGTDSGNWGGSATVGTSRYFYVDWVSYTPLP
jgi:beta-glucanase (GH16 family)